MVQSARFIGSLNLLSFQFTTLFSGIRVTEQNDVGGELRTTV